MGYRRLLVAAVVAASILACASSSLAGEARVMVAIGLLDFGEDAKVVSVYDFNKYRPDYDEFRKLLSKSATLAEMAEHGWTIVHAGHVRDEYHMVIFERGTRPY